MTLRPCAGCQKIRPGKPVTIYSAWNNAGERNSWKSQYCFSCAAAEFKALMEAAYDPNDELLEFPETCSICGGELDDDPALTNASTYRGNERRTLQWATCPGCAQVVRNKLTEGGEPLESRPQYSDSGDGWGRPQPSPQASAAAGLPW